MSYEYYLCGSGEEFFEGPFINGVFPALFGGHARAILLVVRVERGLTNAVVHAESYFTNAIFCADTTATVFTGCSRLSRGHGF